MRFRATPHGLEVWTPAKLNLFLEVVSRRGDGFHEIETLLCPIGLEDTLTFRDALEGEIELACRWSAADHVRPTLPVGEENTVVRALTLLRQAAAIERGARVRLTKRIPAEAGLAGGSSDAAATLAAANRVWGLHWPRERLAEVAAAVGSDVPFFLHGQPAIGRGRGERLERLDGMPRLDFVLVHPPQGLATADVYRACRPAEKPRSVLPLVTAWRRGDRAAVGRLLHNGLQAASRGLTPWVERLEREFARLDTLGHAMTGSGSAYFGLCRSPRQARRLAAVLRGRGMGQVFAVSSAGPRSLSALPA